MKTVSIGDFKTNLSEIAQKVLKGEEFIVTHGRKKTKMFKVSPLDEVKQTKRKLGILKGKVKVKFHDDWEMSEEELLDL
jgi:antitoxin (DNA-binding transcriptional repressor) of toxin-antitoxin stability system